MKYKIILLLILSFNLAVSASYANSNSKTSAAKQKRHYVVKPKYKDAAPKTEKMLILYSEPHTKAKIVSKVSPWKQLVKIYQKGDWVKVGDPETGDVGWVSLQQYRQLMKELTKPKVQTRSRTVYIQQVSNPMKPGKYKITAYENGKRVSQKRAEQLLKETQRQQMQSEDQFQKIQRQMQEMFEDSMRDFDNFDSFNNFQLMRQPTIIVIQPPSK